MLNHSPVEIKPSVEYEGEMEEIGNQHQMMKSTSKEMVLCFIPAICSLRRIITTTTKIIIIIIN